jgi:serine/threonine-protein kinase
MLAGAYVANPDFRRRMRHEARAAARLAHPRIGVVYDYGELRSWRGSVTPYVVMELIDGPALGERLHDGPLPVHAALGVCAQIAEGLDAAHARGLVHRDVKPGNVMLSAGGVKVVDFGISALVGAQADQAVDGKVLGTPAYIAPERLIGAPVGTAADVYALGIVLYKSVTGHSPWQATDAAEMVAAHLSRSPEALPSIDGLSDEVRDLYQRCLAKEPDQRPEAGEVAAILASAAGLPNAPAARVDPAPALATSYVITPSPARDCTTLLPAETTAVAMPGSARMLAGRRGTRALPRPFGAAGRLWAQRLPVSRARRRAVAGLALLPVVGLAGGLIVTTNNDRHPQVQAAPAQAAAAPAVAAPSCAVTYRVGTDDGAIFSGTLTLDDWRAAPRDGWTVSFDLPADQTFVADAPATSTQSGSRVTVRLPQPDPAGGMPGSAAVTVSFTGTYRSANPMPSAFMAGNNRCTPVLIGPSAASNPPSTSDGGTGAQVAAQTGGGAPGGAARPGPGPAGGGHGKGKGKGKDD